MLIKLNSFDLAAAEKALCVGALNYAGSIVDAAYLLGITRHALKRRILKHQIPWPPKRSARVDVGGATASISADVGDVGESVSVRREEPWPAPPPPPDKGS